MSALTLGENLGFTIDLFGFIFDILVEITSISRFSDVIYLKWLKSLEIYFLTQNDASVYFGYLVKIMSKSRFSDDIFSE